MKIISIPSTPQPIRPSKWASRPHTRVHPKLLRIQIGDGKQEVMMSFYHAPEIEILVKFDSTLPLDLPDSERFKPYEGKRSFRDFLGEIYEACEQIEIRRSWNRVIEGGSNWCRA